MSSMQKRQDAELRSVAEQAAEWLLILEDGSPEDQAQFSEWLTQSPQHVGAFLRASAVDSLVCGIDPEKAIPLEQGTFADVVELHHPPVRDPVFRPSMVKTFAAAASVTLAVIGLTLVGIARFSTDPARHYAAAVGEQRVLELEDGSTMYLAPGSSVDTTFGSTERIVRLLQGEAMFQVRHDASRPFRVHSGRAVVQAVGTRFSVTRVREESLVSVVEGVVQLSREATALEKVAVPLGLARPTGAPIRLSAGQESRAPDKGEASSPRASTLDPVRNWKERRLTFLNESLYAIAEEFNRFNRVPKIRILDDGAGELRFAAAFSADDPQSLATVLQTNPALIVEQSASEIRIRSKR